MKRLKWLAAMSALVMLCLGFYACGDPDDDDGSGGNSGLVGTWVQEYGSGQTETVTFGRDGSYICINYTPGMYINNKWYSASTQTRKGSYSYNEATKLLVVNIVAVSGSNGAYTRTYLVHTLDATTLVLIDSSYGDSYYYNRK